MNRAEPHLIVHTSSTHIPRGVNTTLQYNRQDGRSTLCPEVVSSSLSDLTFYFFWEGGGEFISVAASGKSVSIRNPAIFAFYEV